MRPINIDKDDLTLEQVKQKVADELGVKTLESIKIDLSPTKKDIVIDSAVHARTLKGDYNLEDGAVISVRVTHPTTPTVKEKTLIQSAQAGLIRAITNAQDLRAHIIITVGSCLQTLHDDDNSSLLRQQFPIVHLGKVNDTTPIHFIHIDPAFGKPIPHVKQLHEMEGWSPARDEAPNKTYAHSAKPYIITTIAASLSNIEEGRSYFNEQGSVKTLLDVPLHKYIINAQKNGTGFITGNFYDSKTLPVIAVEARERPEVGEESNNAPR